MKRKLAQAAEAANLPKKEEILVMKKYLTLSVLLIPVILAGCSHPQPVAYYPPPPPPPPAYAQIAQQGFHDGFLAAQADMRNGRPPGAAKHPKFRTPPVPVPAWAEYRHGFREGYQRALHAVPPPPGL